MFFNVHIKPVLPGLFLTTAVALVAKLAEQAERTLFGHGWIESLVFAILLGVVVRSVFGLSKPFHHGVRFCAKTVLEIAIVLLGASISAQALGQAGFGLIAAIILVVCASLFLSFHIGAGAWPVTAFIDAGGLWQFDLRQFGDCRDRASDFGQVR